MRSERDDPRLTAYALGEMDARERAAFEVELAGDAEARRVVDEIRVTASLVREELRREPVAELAGSRRAAIERAMVEEERELRRPQHHPTFRLLFQTPISPVYKMAAAITIVSGAVTLALFHYLGVGLPLPSTKHSPVVRYLTIPTERTTGGPAYGGAAPDGQPFFLAGEHPHSTLSPSVGSTSYADVKSFLTAGRMPPKEAVRIEELINHFDYRYDPPRGHDAFAVHVDVAGAPWAGQHRLVRIGLKGREAPQEQANGSRVTIAKDLDVQVEFNPGAVSAYRLIGYEGPYPSAAVTGGRPTGDVVAGHTLTALYEIIPAGSDSPAHQEPRATTDTARRGALFDLTLRYNEPDTLTARLSRFSVRDSGLAFAQAPADFRFAAAVAAFGMVLRDSAYRGTSTIALALDWLRDSLGDDPSGSRHELVALVERAKSIMRE